MRMAEIKQIYSTNVLQECGAIEKLISWNGLGALLKVKLLLYDSAIPLSIYSRETKKICHISPIHKYIYNFICSSPKLETS